MHEPTMTRRRMLGRAGAGLLVLLAGPRRLAGDRGGRGDHPEPRPGIDGSRVLGPENLGGRTDLLDIYDGIRRIPHIADGIRCSCGCAASERYRSLLTCFEDSMALHCEICQTEGRMVVRLHGAGRTLDEIRAAVDARFG